MTGSQFLDFLCGTSTSIGLMDKSGQDTAYRSFMLSCLNLTLKDIQNRQHGFHWKFLEKTATASTVANQLDYDLPTDIDGRKVFGVFDRTQDITYRYIDHDEFTRKVPDPSDNTGDTVWYTIWAGNLKFFPIPDGAWTYYIQYIKQITPLADDSNSCEIPAKYDGVIIDGALRYAYKFDPQMGQEANQIQIYENGILTMQRDNSAQIDNLSVMQSHRYRNYRIVEPYPLDTN